MTVAVVAVDINGTFLDSTSSYDRERFTAVYEARRARGASFVVASGNCGGFR